MKIIINQVSTLIYSKLKATVKSILNISKKTDVEKLTIDSKGTALLCYLGYKTITHHTNSMQQKALIEILKSRGYTVDLIANDSLPVYNIKCDYLIGFGASWRKLAKNTTAKKILYATEAPPFLAYLNEARAISKCEGGNKSNKKLQRTYKFYYDDDYLLADAIIQMGEFNSDLLKRIQAFEDTPIHTISSYGLGIDKSKTKQHIKRGFLWFGSHGAIHKGLDKVIAAFRDLPHIDLYVAGCSLADFQSFNPTKNVIYEGVVDVSSDRFDKIANACISCILPSASEGLSTATITCMYQGLIPIITKETNIKCPDAIFIRNTVPEIKSAIEFIYEIGDSKLKEISENVQLFAINNYSNNSFRETIEIAIDNILN